MEFLVIIIAALFLAAVIWAYMLRYKSTFRTTLMVAGVIGAVTHGRQSGTWLLCLRRSFSGGYRLVS